MDNEEVGPAVIPEDKDILFGRGGMTKHHAGNGWFRDLMKANRALYTASPKHHKLQLVEDIVDYILAQNCRFLQRRKNSSIELWYPVSYKRAVVKTSQAFRDAHRYETTAKEKAKAPSSSISSTVMAPTQQLLIMRALRMQEALAMNSGPRSSIDLLPPPTEWGQAIPHERKLGKAKAYLPSNAKESDAYITEKQNAMAEALQEQSFQQLAMQSHVPLKQTPGQPMLFEKHNAAMATALHASLDQSSVQQHVPLERSVAQQMLALFELAQNNTDEQKLQAITVTVPQRQLPQQQLASACGSSADQRLWKPTAIRLAPTVEAAPEPTQYTHQGEIRDETAHSETDQNPSSPRLRAQKWAELNAILNTSSELQEDDQFADAEE